MSEHFQVAIIGAGPGGLGAACNAAQHKMSHVLFEKREIGNTIFDYQLRKHVMAEPGKLPLRAHVGFEAGTREEILEEWNASIPRNEVNVKKGEVTKIEKQGDKFLIESNNGSITADNVVLTIGVQGSPRKLPAEGADQPHIAYTLSDPDAFTGKHIMVVGAGDAAIENAIALAEKNTVSLINRRGEFARAKDANNALILQAISQDKIRCYYNSNVAVVTEKEVILDTADGQVTVKCDHIIARLGCIMPRKFVESCGVEFPNPDPTTPPVVNGKYESNVPGLYIVGALIGYPLIKQAMNQGHEVIEHILGNDIEPADQVLIEEVLQDVPGDTNENLKKIREALPLFRQLSDPQFREFLTDSTVHLPKAGDIVFERNDYTDTFYSVVSGEVVVVTEDGREFPIKEGNFFGEMGLISGRRRNATVKCSKDAILVETLRRQVLKLIASVDDVRRQLDEIFMYRALQTNIFPEVDASHLMEVVKRSQFKKFKKGEQLFAEGDLGDFLYFIRKGSVKISRMNSSGKDVTQTYLPAGNYVGEMALLTEEPLNRTATATAAVNCETVLIGRDDFKEILDKYPQLRERILKVAEERMVQNVLSSQDNIAGSMLDFVTDAGITDADNVLIIDSDLCVGCDNCEKACAATHDGTSRLDRKGGQSFASIQIPVSCRHCENPLCMTDCPPDALTRRPDGEVIIRDSCIGCGNCTRNCPYGVIQLVHEHEDHGFSLFGLFKKKGEEGEGATKAAKCDLCEGQAGGPACVRACPTGAAIRTNPSTLLQIISAPG